MVAAIHGGFIELGTSAIAQCIAGPDFSLYLFEGLNPQRFNGKDRFDLHITSHLFDEKEAVSAVRNHSFICTVHGCPEDQKGEIFIGGRHRQLMNELMYHLQKAGFSVGQHPLYPGRRKSNICNQGRLKQGVQLEFTAPFRDDREKIRKASLVIRDTLLSAFRRPSTPNTPCFKKEIHP